MSTAEPPTSDRQLWQQACLGDPDAFGTVFDRHARAVYNHCFRRTAAWSAAEDLTSVVFLEAWRRREEVVLHQESALPWLLGVANRVLSQRRRSLRRHRAALARLPAPAATADPADEVAGRVDDERTMRRLLDELDALPDRDRQVIMLCVWQGLDYAAAATALGVPVGTVRSRLSRARARLSHRLAARSGPGRPTTTITTQEETT